MLMVFKTLIFLQIYKRKSNRYIKLNIISLQGVTILLAFFVNSLVVSDYTPEASSELPVIGSYSLNSSRVKFLNIIKYSFNYLFEGVYYTFK